MTTDNFTELKRLFDTECARLTQIATDHLLQKYNCKTANKAFLGRSKRQGVALLLAALLEGHTISSAYDALTEARSLFDCAHKVSAAALYSKYESGVS